MLRESYTAVVAQGEIWRGAAATEPYEVGWAGEAMFFVRVLSGDAKEAVGRVQVSADGMHWADEGTEVLLPGPGEDVAFCRVHHFGQYLRLAATLPKDAECEVLVSLSVKT